MLAYREQNAIKNMISDQKWVPLDLAVVIIKKLLMHN